ncbi:MAG: hypothetical protein NC921_04030 [Candidatus Omnitrophica bacterium]|nr:hypothetical protein [Candidatus Omnitrophota bacterium]
MERARIDYLPLDDTFLKDEENWNEFDKQIYKILEYHNSLSFYSHISDSAKKYIIDQAMSVLDENEKFLVYLIFYENLSYRTIASKLEMPLSSFYVYIVNILEKMKKYIEENYGDKIFKNREQIHNI